MIGKCNKHFIIQEENLLDITAQIRVSFTNRLDLIDQSLTAIE